MDNRIKVGVIGLARGSFILRNAKHLADHMVVTGVCESDPEILEKAKNAFSEETKIYDDFDSLIHSGIDAVALCNFFPDHAECAIKAFEAGVAVFSETTAAPSLGLCVDLVEAYEKYNGKYMLAANCPYYRAVHAMKEKIEKEEYGKVVYADAEYIHPVTPEEDVLGMTDKNINTENLHWRQTLPAGYYNMHSLGPIMYITGSVPVKVVAKVVAGDSFGKLRTGVKSFGLYEMDNGIVVNSTGCVSVGSKSKWYRVACEKGTMETVRYQESELDLIEADHTGENVKTTTHDWVSSNVLSEDDQAKYASKIEKAGHGGIDFALLINFIKFMRGEQEAFFDVYRACALSSAGILSWYSALSGSKEMTIPDYHKKEDRDKVRGDYRMPFAKKYSDLTLPCKLGEKFEL